MDGVVPMSRWLGSVFAEGLACVADMLLGCCWLHWVDVLYRLDGACM
jgi:hypothetical protein